MAETNENVRIGSEQTRDKKTRKTAASKADQATQSEDGQAAEPSSQTDSQKQLVSVKNLTDFQKSGPDSERVFPPGVVVKDVVLTDWLRVQIEAGLFAEV